jgi:hypothetical protein
MRECFREAEAGMTDFQIAHINQQGVNVVVVVG